MRTFPDVFKLGLSAGASALMGKRVLSCLWELTYRCTAKCGICPYWKKPSRQKDELTLQEIQIGLKKIHAYGCRIVNFTGGEPTIRDDLEDIVHCASQLGMWTSMVTNGSLITQNRMQDLKKAGLDNLFVSLDSIDPHTHDSHRDISGSYHKVLQCMRWLRQDFLTGHRTGGLMCVLSKMNVPNVDKIIQLASRLGVYVVFQPYHDKKTGDPNFTARITEDTVNKILELKKKYKNILCSVGYLKGFPKFYNKEFRSDCHAGQKYFSIDPFGFLHPCVDMPSAGHLLKDNIKVVRTTQTLQNVRSCQGCWYCFRGEADHSLSLTGYLKKIQLGCSVFKENTFRKST